MHQVQQLQGNPAHLQLLPHHKQEKLGGGEKGFKFFQGTNCKTKRKGKRTANEMNKSKLWNKDVEKEFFIKTLEIATPEQLFYVTEDGRYLAY